MASLTNMEVTIADGDLLARLPPELRNMVYGELFFSEGKTTRVNRKEQNKLAVLLTSRLYYNETSSFFYENSHFVLDATSKSLDGGDILPPIPNGCVHYLKRVTIVVSTGHTSLASVRKAAAMLTALVETGASFEEIHIRITPPEGISAFSNNRFDDSIMDINHSIVNALECILSAKIAKTIRIELCHTWFGPDVATHLNDLFTAGLSATSHDRLLFTKGDNFAQGSVVHDSSECERAPRGAYYRTTANDWNDFDLALNPEMVQDISSPDSDGSFESLTDLDIDSDASTFMALFSPSDGDEFTSEDELEDDGMEEDEIKEDEMDDEEIDIAQLMSETDGKTFENMVTFAPHLLLA